MNAVFTLLFCAMLAVSFTTADDEMDQAEANWTTYKAAHGETYNPYKDAMRKKIFSKMDARIQKYNSDDHSFMIGHNVLSDKAFRYFLHSLKKHRPTAMDQAEAKWAKYKAKHGRRYSPSEDAMRKEIFLKTDARIQKHNSEDHSYKMGHNDFSDMTVEEKQRMLGVRIPAEELSLLNEPVANKTDEEWQTPPASLDYRTDKCLVGVKNQGRTCNSCWAFTAIAPLEFSHCKKYGAVVSLSEQQLVDCDHRNSGCGPGWVTRAWDYIQKAGGSALGSAYPYKAVAGVCKFTKGMAKAKVLSHSGSTPVTIGAIKNALVKYGPLSAAIQVQGGFENYKGGVYAENGCPNDKKTTNHAVNIVGYGTTGGVDYWIVRNSWGTKWGIGGYILMKRGVNLCNIESWVRYVQAA